MKSIIFASIIGFCLFQVSFAQIFRAGLLDNELTDFSKKVNIGTVKSYSVTKKSTSYSSLKMYTPTPRDQGNLATCAGWAAGYSARSIIYNKNYSIVDESTKNQKAFSPGWSYRLSVPYTDSPTCEKGAYLKDTLDKMKESGAIMETTISNSACPGAPTYSALTTSKTNKIKEYSLIYQQGQDVDGIKQSLQNGNPVVAGIEIYRSFSSVHLMSGQEQWPNANGLSERRSGGHAISVVSYDDSKFGGAFEIMNSQGTTWGINGYTWIKYSDFKKYVTFAYEMVGEPLNTEKQVMDASISLLDVSKNPIPIIVNNNKVDTRDAQLKGTRFQIKIDNKKPAYIYVFALDSNHNIDRLFPSFTTTSGDSFDFGAYLSFEQTSVYLPSKDYQIVVNGDSSRNFLIVLISLSELKIDEIQSSLHNKVAGYDIIEAESIDESFIINKLKQSIGSALLNSEVSFSNNNNSVNIKSQKYGSSQSVIPLVIKMDVAL